MTDLLEETTRDFKDEQKVQLFRKILPYIITISAVVATGLWYSDWHADNNREQLQQFGDKYLAPYLQGITPNTDLEELDPQIKASELVYIRAIANKVQLGDNIGAMQLARKTTELPEVTSVTQAFANLTFANLAIDQKQISEEDKALLEKILSNNSSDLQKSLDDNKPFAINLFLANIVQNIKLKQYTQARTLLESMLKIDNLSDEARMRAIALNNEIDRLN